MAFSLVNVGTVANDGTGDDLRAAMQVLNANWTALNDGTQAGAFTRVILDPGATATTTFVDRDIALSALHAKVTSGRPALTIESLNDFLSGASENAHLYVIHPFDLDSDDENFKSIRISAGASSLVDKFHVTMGGHGYFAGQVAIGMTDAHGNLTVEGEGRAVTIGDSGLANRPVLKSRNFSDTSYALMSYDAFDHQFKVEGTAAVTIHNSGGAVVGSATGGDPGAGKINAVEVQDDGTPLSCYVFDQALDGEINIEGKWDPKVPDRIAPARTEERSVYESVVKKREIDEWDEAAGHYVRKTVDHEVKRKVMDYYPVVDETGAPVLDESGDPVLKAAPRTETVEIPEELIEARIHEPLRKFAARIGTEHDPLTLDGYAAHWKEKRHLTSMPNEANYDPVNGKLGIGVWVQRLIETVEIQAVLIEQLNQRVKALEA